MSSFEPKSRVTYWPALCVVALERANVKREIVGVRGVWRRRMAWEREVASLAVAVEGFSVER
jgi:hypothetical protein